MHNVLFGKWNKQFNMKQLPNEVIVMTTVDSFKNALGKFWSGRKALYDWEVNLAGIGSRSEININKRV
jgi:hypothetical protein